MEKIIICLCVAIFFAFCLVQVASADDVSNLKERIRQLEEENRILREKIASTETTKKAEILQQEAEILQQEPEIVGIEKVEKEDRKGWMTAEYQFDTRGFNTINFTGGADLPLGFTIWGFTDIETTDRSRQDAERFFLEIDLRRELYKGFGLVAEYNDGHLRDNSLGRFGFNYIARWEWLKRIDLSLYFKLFPIETDGHGWQVSFAWNKKFPRIFGGRFSMGGFFDANFDSGPNDDETDVVSDTQFRFLLIDGLEALVEFRFNEYKIASEEYGFGIGLKYSF